MCVSVCRWCHHLPLVSFERRLPSESEVNKGLKKDYCWRRGFFSKTLSIGFIVVVFCIKGKKSKETKVKEVGGLNGLSATTLHN